ncbi:MAG: ABC transporter substrate-binding protein [Phascolarctobacterium sp.]
MKKIISLLLAVMLLLVVAGCGKQEQNSGTKAANGKEKVTIALWGNDLLENYTRYLVKKFPEVEFEFVLAINSTDFYKYRSKNKDLPDIMTVRRFSMRDAVELKDLLYDLSNTELAGTFYGTYLDSYTYSDGTINWLPACAVVDSLIADKTQFEKHGVPLPTDYASLVTSAKALEAKGIKGFSSDLAEDYTCMELLQGFGITQLNSMEGREWRQQYESGKTHQLSEKVWLPVFERFFDLKKQMDWGAKETTHSNWYPKKQLTEGKLAMYRGTGTDLELFVRQGAENIMLPYLGNSQKDNWFLTYPAFQVAASKKGMESPKRRKLILEIMSAMLNQDGQNNINSGNNMVPYNKNVKLELMPSLANLKPYIKENKMYIRIASNEMFKISRIVVHQILRDEIKTPQEALNVFNEELKKESVPDPVVVKIEKGYSNDFTPEHGNQAASAVMNTVRKLVGTDLLFVQACYTSGSVYAGEYTQKELSYLTHSDAAWPIVAHMTGDQIYELVERTLAAKSGYGVISNDSTLYVSSGFEMDLSRTKEGGYKLNKLTIQGKDLERKAQYSILLMGDRGWTKGLVITEMGIKDYTYDVEKCYKYLYKHLVEDKGKLEEPTDYLKLR